MFNLGLSEMILIGIIALIFIGPKQLPEIARTIGRMLNELKRATDDITTSITNPESYQRKKTFEEEQRQQNKTKDLLAQPQRNNTDTQSQAPHEDKKPDEDQS